MKYKKQTQDNHLFSPVRTFSNQVNVYAFTSPRDTLQDGSFNKMAALTTLVFLEFGSNQIDHIVVLKLGYLFLPESARRSSG